ncbi:MAG: tRNA pseudouridine13 synthase [Cognaticolwellia sp.]|jgi:tRNA pseudouridine13 synthase|tara:strand:- start:294 stop:1958 length:1665 start_codon:yes stop_codon:yes gene_type:complete
MRIGHGFDVHQFGGSGPLILGGVAIPYEFGFIAHSDGDVAIHALCDAILGALCLADIGNHFPDTDGDYENISSRILLRHVVGLMQEKGFSLGNADITICAQAPKMAPHLVAMRECLAEDLQADIEQVNVKATTTEKLGYVGRKEGVSVHAVVLLMKTDNNNKIKTATKPAIKNEVKPVEQSQSPLPEFSYLYGKPKSTGLLRQHRSDFKVFEQIPFEPCGEGEHLFIHIRKTGANTAFVAKQLAHYFSVNESLVSYAGLKDRFAVTEQWFGVHVPGKQIFDLTDLNIEGVEVLSSKRHNKKLRIGGLDGNRFEITLRDVTDIDELVRRWHVVSNFGVPNYFGEQRFGINGGNIEKAMGLFSGQKVKDKKKRGMYLSAARSLIFNQMISQRIEQKTFDSIINGDVLMLAGTQSVFRGDLTDESLTTRLVEHDLDITAPMWGAGELMTTDDARAFEQSIADGQQAFCEGLPRFGLKQERRRIRLIIKDTEIKVDNDVVTLSFFLSSGAYATTIMRELIDYTDLTERVDVSTRSSSTVETKAEVKTKDHNAELTNRT